MAACAFRRDRAATVRDLVLARVSNRTEILSPSLLRRRRDPNREFLVVLADSATDPDIQPHAASLTHGADRVARCAAIEDTRDFFIGGWLRWFFSSSSVGYGNRHLWYQLPLVPIAAAFAGAVCAFVGSKISSRVIAVTLSILLVSSFATLAFWCVQPFYQSSAAQLRDAGLELKKVTPPDALIVAADMGDPTIFYYGERKGWHFLETDAIYNGNPDDSEQAIENLERLRHRGATHFVFTKNTFWWLQSYPEFVAHLTNNAKVIEATPEFRIYELITVAR